MGFADKIKRLSEKIFSGRDTVLANKLCAQGVAQAKVGRFKDALELYERACRADGEHPQAHLNVALTLLDIFNARRTRMKKADIAPYLAEIARAFDVALEQNCDALVAGRLLGHVSRRLRRYIRAEELFTALLEATPPDYVHRNELERALVQLRPRAERQRRVRAIDEAVHDADCSDDALAEILARYVALLPTPGETDGGDGGDEDDPFGSDDETLIPVTDDNDDPASTDRLFGASVLYKRLGDHVAAQDMLLRLLEQDPEHHQAKRELAGLCAHLGDLKNALAFSIAAYKDDPADAALVCNVGVCHLELGHLDEASEFIALAQDLDPKDPIVRRAAEALAKARPSA